MSSIEAKRRCPHAVCVHPRISHYSAESERIFAIFHEFTPLVQGLSLDEAFLVGQQILQKKRVIPLKGGHGGVEDGETNLAGAVRDGGAEVMRPLRQRFRPPSRRCPQSRESTFVRARRRLPRRQEQDLLGLVLLEKLLFGRHVGF